jgi:hypothetical protein
MINKQLFHQFGKIFQYSLRVLDLLLLVAILGFSLILVREWAAEQPASSSNIPLFQSPLPGIILVKQTPTPRPAPALNPTFTNELFYLSLANDGTYPVGSIPDVSDEDILRFEGAGFIMFFDGSDVGLGSADLDALTLVDSNTILMSFRAPITITNLGLVDDADIVQFEATTLGSTTAGNFSWFFDGSDVGLIDVSENVNGLDLLPNGQLLISTDGAVTVPGLTAGAQDVLIFTPTALGATTGGTWAIYFDGSDVGLGDTAGENIDGIGLSNSGSVYITTTGSFSVTGISGEKGDVFVCISVSMGDNTACIFSSALSFNSNLWGLSGNDVDAIDPLP